MNNIKSTVNSRSVGDIIRQFRVRRNLTGETLGKLAGYSQSKISKIEHGYLPMQSNEIQKLINILNVPLKIQQHIIDDLLAPQDASIATNFVFNLIGIDQVSRQAEHRHIRCFGMSAIPLLLQTVPYRRAILEMTGVSSGDMASHITRTQERQDMLWDKDRKYEIIISEAALYGVFTTSLEHSAQLDRIERCLELSSPRVGILPMRVGTVSLLACNFVLFDDKILVRELGHHEVEDTGNERLRQFGYLFEEIRMRALYGQGARQLLRDAINELEG